MKYSVAGAALSSLALANSVLAAYVPSEPWSTLTPSETLSGGSTDYSGTFGIAVVPITSSVSTVLAKRDLVSQINDGQIQATTATTTKAKSTAQPISQISDGQIQATTSTVAPKSTAQAISQISDGQIQASTATKAKSTAQPISQISDGQIQATTATVQPISQIGDGQIQASTTTKAHSSATGISQISDGQIQATKTTSGASQITDGQVQASKTASAAASDAATSEDASTVACKVDGTLQLTLEKSILKDSAGRIGSIVANRQFQFDGPPPQAGAIYAAGWSIADGNLAIGNTSIFYQCLSGTFYNLYDKSLGIHCKPVNLEVTALIDC